ncbi:MAG: carbohydrate binding family 9 domain-containing protein [Thermoanaerobaculum sp.]|nr:carbohydrate binding family 9 domain-containing protein [Thermoanaerobaculum sp.]MDW7968559.1 DUF5916 domain-containing protein [Thermoanaerobaculum sp.]
MKCWLGLLALAMLLKSMAQAQVLDVPEVVSTIRVDGYLDEPVWQQALVVDLPFEIDPGENTPAPVRTTCLLLSTPQALFVGFLADDPNPAEIRAHLSDRDRLFRDDFVGFMLDTFADKRKAYEFLVNPLGVQADAIRSETATEDPEDFTFDAIWEAAGRITPQGYEVEMAIPFAALRFPSHPGPKRWGFVAMRAYPRSLRRLLASAPVDRNNACTVCQFPELSGFASATPGRRLELNPSFAGFQSQRREAMQEPRMSPRSRRGDTGFSLLWGLTSNLSLTATVNPDFSQVEADAAQLEVNRTFALFYPEKRPFFLEGAENFATPMHIVHTRSLADPQWGIKLTGKEGRSALGFLAVRDEITNLLLPGVRESSQTTLPQPSDAGVLRYRYDLGRSSVLGAVATFRQAAGYWNRLAGLDGMLRFSESTRVQFQLLRSQTRYPRLAELDPSLREKTLEGDAWQLHASHESRHWEAWAFFRNVEEGFRADLGFLPQVGTRGYEVGGQRVFWGTPNSFYSRLSLGGEVEEWEDQQGNLLNRRVAVMGRYAGPLQSMVFVRVWRFSEVWQGTEYRGHRLRLFGNVRFSGAFTSSLGVEAGDTVDYVNSQGARLVRLSPGFTWNIGRRLYLQGDFVGERLRVNQGELYHALVASWRSWYHFSTRSYLRLIFQETRVVHRPQLYRDPPAPRSKKTGVQLLFAYKLNPQSLLFFGYDTNLRGNDQIKAVTMGRTLFLKVSYNWLI